MMDAMPFANCYDGRRVLVTGHTGFKGAWLALWLRQLNAEVTGYSKDVPTTPSLFSLCGLGDELTDCRGDICDGDSLAAVFSEYRPEIVFHMAAQPIVRTAYEDPYDTVRVNVLGTVRLLECARVSPGVKAVVVVTSDKCYDNAGSLWAFRESDPLGGKEPYAASKACAELVASVYQSAVFHQAAGSASTPAVATARAGNVIGGGDWARDRLIPDIVRCVTEGRDVDIRYPDATRPWQHVLEPLSGYLWLAACLCHEPDRYASAWNFGPEGTRMWTVRQIVDHVLEIWTGHATRVSVTGDLQGKESAALRVDSSKAAHRLDWLPVWDTATTLAVTTQWYRAWTEAADLRALTRAQIDSYVQDAGGSAWASGRFPA